MTDADIIEIASLIHGKWSDSFQLLQAVKAETDDGSPDWAGFHELRLAHATEQEERWGALNQRFIDEHRAVIKRSFGL